jgi:hypothetical protein
MKSSYASYRGKEKVSANAPCPPFIKGEFRSKSAPVRRTVFPKYFQMCG